MQVICFASGSVVHYFVNSSGISGNVGSETMHNSWDCGIDVMDCGVFHCACGFHCVPKEVVEGFYVDGEFVIVRCRGKCHCGGWHLESGCVVSQE